MRPGLAQQCSGPGQEGWLGPSHGHGSLLDQGEAEVNQRTAPRLLGDSSQQPP